MNNRYFVILLIIVTLLCLTGCESRYKLDPNESVAYARLNLAVASSAYDGSGSMPKEDLNCLKELVKKFDSNNEWFSELSKFYGRTADTDEKKITYLCDDNYCAKFTVEEKDDSYYLLDYSFESSNDKGYKIYIIDDSNN